MKSSFAKLDVWKESFDFALEIYRLTSSFPVEERYALTSQLKRAASSVPANISEGKGSESDKEFCRFLFIARGSLEESKCHLMMARELDYINHKDFEYIEKKVEKIGTMLNKLINYLTK